MTIVGFLVCMAFMFCCIGVESYVGPSLTEAQCGKVSDKFRHCRCENQSGCDNVNHLYDDPIL